MREQKNETQSDHDWIGFRRSAAPVLCAEWSRCSPSYALRSMSWLASPLHLSAVAQLVLVRHSHLLWIIQQPWPSSFPATVFTDTRSFAIKSGNYSLSGYCKTPQWTFCSTPARRVRS